MAEAGQAAGGACLVLVSEKGVEQRYPLSSAKLTVGRDEGNGIVLNDPWVSRRHASIRTGVRGWVLFDEGSTHLTYLNKKPIKERQEHPLTHGDQLSFGGKISFVFLERDDPEAVEKLARHLRPAEVDRGSYAHFLTQQMDSVFSTLKNRSADSTLVDNLNERVSRSVAELKSLYEIGNAINRETELDRVLDLILAHVIPATAAERGFIMLLDPDGKNLRPVLARNMDASLDDAQLATFSTSIARRALESAKTIVSKDTSSDPDISSKSILDYNIRSAICAPLLAKGKPIGTLYVDAKESMKEFSSKDVDFFTALAAQSAIAVENARLVQELRTSNRDLERRVREVEALFDVSKSLNVAREFRTVLETILDKSIEVIDAERGSIMLYDEGTDILRVKVLRGATQSPGESIGLKRGEGIAGKVAETGIGQISNLGFHDPHFKKLTARERDVREILCVPLKLQDSTLGVINLVNKKNNERFTPDDLRLLQSLATQAAVTIENNRLYNLSIYDGLTGVYVHRYFQAVLLKHFEQARRYSRDISLILIDIDHFKKFNDTYGHQVGDMVLAEVAAIFKRTARVPDVVARYGGEEFAMILPETNLQGAGIFADRIRKLVQDHIIQSRAGPLRVTISLGVSSFLVGHPASKDELIKMADTSLYQAKGAGRNRVFCCGTELVVEPGTELEP